MTIAYRFLEPLDVLFLRGNKLFGDPGSYGESLVPPWPSVAAGALRSRMLADDGVDLVAFARGEAPHATLGTPQAPGEFAVTAFHLARRNADGSIEVLIASPADLVISEGEDGLPSGARLLSPTHPAPGLLSSSHFARIPVLAENKREKAANGYWLTEKACLDYLAGNAPQPHDLIHSSELWKIDPRIGVGLDAATGRASDGRLFSVQAVAMTKREHAPQTGFDVGFLAVVRGAEPPCAGSLRLGGDGRAAAVHAIEINLPGPDYAEIAGEKRCRVVLSTPGIFSGGWLPAGVSKTGDSTYRFDLMGVKGRLVCAAVPRPETVSGWDLAKWQPKAAQRAAPAGSVYWLDDLEATPEALRKLVDHGLWSETCEDVVRRAEGFNRITLAAY